MKTQRELVRHLSMIFAKRKFDREGFGRAVEEYLSEHPSLDKAAEKLVKWTTPGTWTRFLDKCWASYRQWNAAIGGHEDEKEKTRLAAD